MPRFFVEHSLKGEKFAILTGEQAQHAKVLRLKEGDSVTLCDGEGVEYACVISDTVYNVGTGQVCMVIRDSRPGSSEAAVSVTVYMAFSKGDKFEHVIQKATELGANQIVGFPSSRCVAKFDEKTLSKKLSRWQKIAASAAEQSGRGRIPQVTVCTSYAQAISRAAQDEIPLFFYENERQQTLSSALSGGFRTVSIVTGPEGGFSEEEAKLAEEAGMMVCTLGQRILRCETAPLCALSAVMFAAGEY